MSKIKFDYVTSSQGRIYIGGVLVDECYDIQYTYQESKEPIYGYNSKHYDALLPGQVVIYGNFTINYKHDSYLYNVFHAIKANESATASMKRMVEDNAIKNDYTNALKKYKQIQKDLDEKKSRLKTLESLDTKYSAMLKDKELEKDAHKNNFDVKVNNAQQERDVFNAMLTSEDEEALKQKKYDFNFITEEIVSWQKELKDHLAKSNEEISNIQSQLDQYQAMADVYIESDSIPDDLSEQIDNLKDKISDLKDQRDDTTKELSSIIADKNDELKDTLDDDPQLKQAITNDLAVNRTAADRDNFLSQPDDDTTTSLKEIVDENKKDIADIKGQIQSASNDLVGAKTSLQSLKNKEKSRAIDLSASMDNPPTDANGNLIPDMSGWRPEDFGNFNIFIEYDGQVHKILQDCQLTGHSHVVTNSGQNVKEYYNFICNRITG